jgi:sulfur carrier protein
MISINNKEYSHPEEKNLSDLFVSLNIKAEKGVAVAVNQKVIPKSEWNNCIIKKQDKIILIKATQGG